MIDSLDTLHDLQAIRDVVQEMYMNDEISRTTWQKLNARVNKAIDRLIRMPQDRQANGS